MSSLSPNGTGRYALVSSFYGPGATGGWYLTALASLMSYALHQNKRTADSITADIIAVLTFPTVAAAHLISQVRSFPRDTENVDDTTLARNTKSVEAALIITETFLAIDVLLFLLTVGFKCVKRGCLLAAVGLFCFAAECYLYLSHAVKQRLERNFDRPFLINFTKVLICIVVLLFVCITVALILILLFFLCERRYHRLLWLIGKPGKREKNASEP